MSNQFLNPIIQFHTTDTLTCCSECLSYLMESIEHLPLEETTLFAQQGLNTVLDCIRQAIDFEANRTDSELEQLETRKPLSKLERLLIDELLKKLDEKADLEGDDAIIIPPSGGITDH